MSEPSISERIQGIVDFYEKRHSELDAEFRKMGKIVYRLILQSGNTEAIVPNGFEEDWMITFEERGENLHLKIGRTGPMIPVILAPISQQVI